MRRVLTRLLFGVAVAGGLTFFWCQSAATGKPARRGAIQNDEPSPPPQPDDKLMGTATCASMSCHNVNGPRGSKRSEYSTWATFDKHARAFQVLYDERSERIARNLYGEGAHAYEKQLCLNCHSMKHDKITHVGPRFSLADGVSCESCHGPAERWLTVHYQTGFKEKTDDEKAELGMVPTKNLAIRGKICADCHIGNVERGMEVNHDLIAAGHPRLNYEYAGYLHMYPRHWLMADELVRHPDFHARVWAIGQVASAKAAIVQLHGRAIAANKPDKAGRPWPEFTEYDCFACHKDLQVSDTKNDKLKDKYKDRKAGTLPYGTWNLSLTGSLAKLLDADPAAPSSISELKKLMDRPGSPPAAVAARAKTTIKALGDWESALLAKKTLTPEQVQKLFANLATEAENRANALDWDETAQYYLALSALNQGLADLDPRHDGKALKSDLRILGERLKQAFPPDVDSPKKFDPFRSPALDSQFKAIRNQLSKQAD